MAVAWKIPVLVTGCKILEGIEECTDIGKVPAKINSNKQMKDMGYPPEKTPEKIPVLLVLAGGIGSRLNPVVSEVPKALAPVMDNPFLYYQMKNWANQGITKFTFLLHHMADQIIRYVDDMNKDILPDCAINTLVEPSLLGTGGAIAHAVQKLQIRGSFLVTNADTWLGDGIQQIIRTPTPAITVVSVEDANRYGSVTTDGGKVINFEEKATSHKKGWINAGLYHLESRLFNNWNGKPYSFEHDQLPLLAKSGRLNAVRVSTDFVDIGVPDDYFHFCNWIKSKKAETYAT